MSPWVIVTISVVAVGFLSLPLLFARASRSGRMARWDDREESAVGQGLSDRQRRIAWRMRLGLRSAMTAVFLWVMALFLVRHQPVVALLAAAFLALNAGLLLVAVRQRP